MARSGGIGTVRAAALLTLAFALLPAGTASAQYFGYGGYGYGGYGYGGYGGWGGYGGGYYGAFGGMGMTYDEQQAVKQSAMALAASRYDLQNAQAVEAYSKANLYDQQA